MKFDRRPQNTGKSIEGKDGEKITFTGVESFAKWSENLDGNWKKTETKEVVVNKIKATRSAYINEFDAKDKVFGAMLAYEYKLAPDLEVVVLGFGPGDAKKWNKFENAYDSIGKSFKAVPMETKVTVARGTTPRDFKRAELETEIKTNPGWQLFETPNYFVITSKIDDKQFIQELMERLEAIHEIYLELYPPQKAKELRALAEAASAAEEAKKKAEGGTEPGAEGDEPKEGVPTEGQTAAPKVKVDPMELAKCSVVRVCKNQEEYMSYGAPGGSAGYWYWVDEELVIYDDQASGGRRDTWATLNHEAFHQYIYYLVGQIAPHSWYNEGTGDYFAGYQLEHQKFKLKPFDWRVGLVVTNLKADKIVPLKEFVYYEQPKYYGNSKYGTTIGDHYAQGWSLIYFLRTGKKSARCWNPEWDTILDVYLHTLCATSDAKMASDKAFAAVDFDELQKCWSDYILGL